LKVSLDLIDLSSAGSAFHTAGPAKENARLANLVYSTRCSQLLAWWC